MASNYQAAGVPDTIPPLQLPQHLYAPPLQRAEESIMLAVFARLSTKIEIVNLDFGFDTIFLSDCDDLESLA